MLFYSNYIIFLLLGSHIDNLITTSLISSSNGTPPAGQTEAISTFHLCDGVSITRAKNTMKQFSAIRPEAERLYLLKWLPPLARKLSLLPYN